MTSGTKDDHIPTPDELQKELAEFFKNKFGGKAMVSIFPQADGGPGEETAGAEQASPDLKFDLKHFADIERLALVGDKKWEKGMSVFCKPFTTAKIRYFDRAAIAEARAWLEQN